jgi:hypothetical protein
MGPPLQDKEAMRKAILEEVAPDQLPERYGGTGKAPLYDSPYEQELAQHVRRNNVGAAASGGGGREGGDSCGGSQ